MKERIGPLDGAARSKGVRIMSATLREMQTYYEGHVEEPDIDNLGHMNVRVYARKAAAATHALIASLGLDRPALDQSGAVIQMFDGHTRFYHEQLEEAPLEVRGGVLEAAPGALDIYLELINPQSDDLAATFRILVTLHDGATQVTVAFPDSVLAAARELAVEWPEHGQPRSLALQPWTPHVKLATVDASGLTQRFEPRTIDEEDCDAYGYLNIASGESLAFYRMPIKWHGPTPDFVPLSGQRRGIATVESRQVVFTVPRLGDSLVTHSVIVEVGTKHMQFRHWSFNGETGEPFAVLAQFGLGFDLEARRSSDFPPEMRAKLEESARPQFA